MKTRPFCQMSRICTRLCVGFGTPLDTLLVIELCHRRPYAAVLRVVRWSTTRFATGTPNEVLKHTLLVKLVDVFKYTGGQKITPTGWCLVLMCDGAGHPLRYSEIFGLLTA